MSSYESYTYFIVLTMIILLTNPLNLTLLLVYHLKKKDIIIKSNNLVSFTFIIIKHRFYLPFS